MEKGVLSAKGVRVDFDLLRIKEQIVSAPKTTTVKAREDFIDKKFSRRLKRQITEVKQQVPVVTTEPKGEPEEQPSSATETPIVTKQIKTKDK